MQVAGGDRLGELDALDQGDDDANAADQQGEGAADHDAEETGHGERDEAPNIVGAAGLLFGVHAILELTRQLRQLCIGVAREFEVRVHAATDGLQVAVGPRQTVELRPRSAQLGSSTLSRVGVGLPRGVEPGLTSWRSASSRSKASRTRSSYWIHLRFVRGVDVLPEQDHDVLGVQARIEHVQLLARRFAATGGPPATARALREKKPPVRRPRARCRP